MKHILVVGAGSVGQRHAVNLSSLGCKISCVDPRPDRLKEIEEKIPLQNAYEDLRIAFQKEKNFDGVAVTSPPLFHVDQSLAAIQQGLPILLEKPVSPDEPSARKLYQFAKKSSVPILLGYTYRWWEPLGHVRDLIRNNTIGHIYHVQFVMSAHLADWHPWERYQDFFMAHKNLGGGALLDESHWLDLMLWIFGLPESIFARIEKISNLEIDTDDNVDMIIQYPNGLRCLLHLDLFGRPHQKYIRFIGDKGTILWTVAPNQIAVHRGSGEEWQYTEYQCERNAMFLGVAQEFLSIVNGGQVATCTLEDGLHVMALIEAARKSDQEGRSVKLSFK